MTIRWIEDRLNKYINKLLSTDGVDYIIAMDTDSVYLNLEGIVNKAYTGDVTDVRKVIRFLDKVSKTQIQPFIDQSYAELAEYLNAYTQAMVMKRESISNRGIWTAKKNYILNVYDNEGVEYVTPEIKITGLSAVKSSTPSSCRVAIKKAIEIMMNNDEETLQDFVADFRTKFSNLPIDQISFPRGVNGIVEYADENGVPKKGTPGHVKAALTYNKHISAMGLEKKYRLIRSGDKMKFVYLKQPNVLKSDTIAFMGDPPEELNINRCIDYDTQYDKAFVNQIDIILRHLGWNAKKVSNLSSFYE